MRIYSTERHIVRCWMGALFDMAENLGDDAPLALIREAAECALAEGSSTCLCHEDDEWYAAHPAEARPEAVSVEDAARIYGFAYDMTETEN